MKLEESLRPATMLLVGCFSRACDQEEQRGLSRFSVPGNISQFLLPLGVFSVSPNGVETAVDPNPEADSEFGCSA